MEERSRHAMNAERRDFCRRVSASGLPVFSLVPGEYPEDFLIWDQIKPNLPKVVVITIPRSGTHFTSKLLEGMGMIYGGLHLAPSLETDVVEDRRGRKMSPRGKLTFRRYRLPLPDVFRMLGPGQFVQGHVRYREDFVAALADCKIVYVKRDLRGVAVSAMRFIAHLSAAGHVFAKHWDTRWIGLDDGPLKMYGYLQSFGTGLPDLKNAIEPWQHESNAFVLDFDRLTGADQTHAVQCLADLAQFLGTPLDSDALQALLNAATGAETLTWTGKLSRWQDLWSDDVEAAFQSNVLRADGGEGYVSDEMEYLLSQHRNVEAKKTNSVISWLSRDGVSTKIVNTDPGADYESFMPDILSERVAAAKESASVALEACRDAWMLEGCTLERTGDWLSLSSLEGYVAHKHLGVPVAAAEPFTIVTFSLLLNRDRSSNRLMLQAGDEQGFFNGFFDLHESIVLQMQNSGGCRSLCARIDVADRESVRLSLCGLMGFGKVPYIRVYLCDARGNLDFVGRAEVQIKQLTVSYGLKIFDFNDPADRDEERE